jgi:outer membrane protein assembly factor BamB
MLALDTQPRIQILDRTMARTKNPETGSVTRWLLIIAAAVIIGFVVVNSIALHMFPFKPGPFKRAATIPVKWEYEAKGPITAGLALADDGTIYAASEAGFLYALDLSGNLKWKFDTGPVKAAPAIGTDGTIYVTNQDQQILAINPTGTLQWSTGGGPFADKQNIWTANALDPNYLYTPWRGQIRAIRLTSGAVDWSAGMGFEKNGSLSILSFGLIVYPGVGRLDALNSTGVTQWHYPPINPPLTTDVLLRNNGHPPQGNFWLDSGIALGADNTLYACVADSRLVAWDSDGHHKWEFKTNLHSLNRASPVIATDGTIYFASNDGYLYALTPDGTKKWSVDSGGTIAATPILAQDETIYALSSASLMEVSPEGKVLAASPAGGALESSPTLAPDGTVYVGSRTGKIIAFAGSHGPLMNSPWPKFQHDLANTGRARPY